MNPEDEARDKMFERKDFRTVISPKRLINPTSEFLKSAS
jgi:hypothetical protein